MLEIVSSAHRVPRAGGARCREDGAVRRTVPCVRTDLAALWPGRDDEADCGLRRGLNSHTQQNRQTLLKKRKASFINWTQRAPIWAPAERLGRRLAATAATAAGQQGLCTRVTLRIVHIGTARTTRAAERCSR